MQQKLYANNSLSRAPAPLNHKPGFLDCYSGGWALRHGYRWFHAYIQINDKRFRRGEIDRKDTFSKRELTDEPKCVQQKRVKAAEAKQNKGIPASESSVPTSKRSCNRCSSFVLSIYQVFLPWFLVFHFFCYLSCNINAACGCM